MANANVETEQFRMERIDVNPLETQRFVFSEATYSNKKPVVARDDDATDGNCQICACGSCQCEYPPTLDEIDVDGGECLSGEAGESGNKMMTRQLRELYLKFYGDQKEWNRFVMTSKLVERKSKNEIYLFSNLAVPNVGAESSEDVQRLTDFQRFVTIGILNEVIDKLVILGANKPKVVPHLDFHPPKDRYNVKIGKRMFDAETNLLIAESEGRREIYRFSKLRTLVEHVLKITRDEISERSTCDALQGFLWLQERRAQEEKSIRTNYNDSLSLIKTLKSLKARNDKDTQLIIEKYEQAKKELKDELQRVMFRNGVYLSYFKEWADAEFESEKWDKDEHYFKWMERELKRSEMNVNTETRVHRDVIVFLNLSMHKLNKDVSWWSDKYEKDMEEKDTEIADMKQKRKDVHKRMAEMLAVFEKRQKEIQKYLQERTERERRAAEIRRLHESATKIQAWWRGTMVRWEFGRYDQGGKKKKPKGKATKGKK